MPRSEQLIYTLRHAAIDYGKERIIAGRMDPPLNQTGIKQCRTMAAAGVNLDYDLVISSPQRRASETAKLVSGLGADEMISSYLCMERNYGHLEGVAPGELEKIQPATYYVRVGKVDHSLNPPGGETLEQLRERVIAFHALVRSMQGKNLLIVSHGTFLQQYHGYLRDFDVYHSLTTSVTYLEANAFRFQGDDLISDEMVYRPDLIEEPW